MKNLERINGPELSLVLVCQNQGSSIPTLLEPWLTHLRGSDAGIRSFEVLLLNNGSTDATGRILDDLRKKYPEVRVFHQLRTSPAVALRRAIEEARGNYLVPLESVPPNDPQTLDRFWNLKERHPAIFAVRTRRREGLVRLAFAHGLRLMIQRLFGCNAQDANCVFGLFELSLLRTTLKTLPQSVCHLPCALSIYMRRQFPSDIYELPVPLPLEPLKRFWIPLWALPSRALSQFAELVWLRRRLMTAILPA